MVVDLQLVDAVLQRLEPAVEMLGNGARVNAGQEFGACEVGKAAGSIAGRDFFELAVFVFSDAEEDYAATGIGGHWDGTLRVHTGCLCSASFARESGAESPAQAESLPHCKWPISRHRLKPVPPKSVSYWTGKAQAASISTITERWSSSTPTTRRVVLAWRSTIP